MLILFEAVQMPIDGPFWVASRNIDRKENWLILLCRRKWLCVFYLKGHLDSCFEMQMVCNKSKLGVLFKIT